MPLCLDARQARTVIALSEGVPGRDGAAEGHTKARHVSISKADLLARFEDGMSDPGMRKRQPDETDDAFARRKRRNRGGTPYWRSAFLDIHSCADLLARTITRIGADPFVRDFQRAEDGSQRSWANQFIGAFDCRDFRGRAKAWHVTLALQKHTARPHAVHLITFYPVAVLPEDFPPDA